jgi:hypothetical protein
MMQARGKSSGPVSDVTQSCTCMYWYSIWGKAVDSTYIVLAGCINMPCPPYTGTQQLNYLYL